MPVQTSWLWLPWVAGLSLLALAGAWLAWRRGRHLVAVRRVGWAIVVWGCWLLGLFSLVWRVVDAVGDWVTRFAFNPAAWAGLVVTVAGLAVVAGTRLADRRRGRDGTPPPPVESGPRRPVGADEDFSDVEAILRKHGIR